TTITNTLIPRTPEKFTELSGKKTWDDDEDIRGLRPEQITVRLLQNGVEILSLTVEASDGWVYSFGELPVDDGYGNLYTYELREDGVPGYYPKVDGMDVLNTLLMKERPKGDETESERPDSGNTDTPKGLKTVENRDTGTPTPSFEEMTEAEMEELFDMFGYDTPLWGMMGTGDETPAWPWAFGGAGALALIALAILTRRRRRT
ncbi:MAG: Cna B-type domain-containing protein, partial [Clostridia bacterium]|nr:Cna B-type domain-containing protein [Clostridia bacterium]